MSALLFFAAAHKHPSWDDFGPVEWVAVVVAGVAAMWTVWKAVMYTLRPGEEDPNHIKRSILFDEVLQATSGGERHPSAVTDTRRPDARSSDHPGEIEPPAHDEGAS